MNKIKTPNAKKQTKFKRLVLEYDLSFYALKNGRLNVAKIARCAGFSRAFVSRELRNRGLI